MSIRFKPRCFFPSPLQQLSSRWWDDQRCVGNQNPEKVTFWKKNHKFDWPRLAHGFFFKNHRGENQPLLVFVFLRGSQDKKKPGHSCAIYDRYPEPGALGNEVGETCYIALRIMDQPSKKEGWKTNSFGCQHHQFRDPRILRGGCIPVSLFPRSSSVKIYTFLVFCSWIKFKVIVSGLYHGKSPQKPPFGIKTTTFSEHRTVANLLT